MSQQHSGLFAKRRTWIGAAIAAAAVVAVAQYGFDFPPRGEDVLGTIVPAQRYRAPQATAQDIKVDGQPAGPSTTAAIPAAQTDSANVAAEAAAKSATEAAAKNATEAAAKSATEAAAQNAAAAAAKSATEAAAKAATQHAAQAAAQQAAQAAANSSAK